MSLYSVRYKEPGAKKWTEHKNVKADLVYESKGVLLPVRVLILSDETRIEVPMSWLIIFGPERFTSIHHDMEKEAGTKIPV